MNIKTITDKIIEKVSNEILEGLKQNNITWVKGWRDGVFKNYTTDKEYSLLNTLLLNNFVIKNKFKSNYFLTYKQIKLLGGNFRSYEDTKNYCMIYKIGFSYYYDKKRITEDIYNNMTAEEKKEVKSYPFLKTYFLYSYDQTTNIKSKDIVNFNIKPIDKIEAFLKSYKELPKINHVGNQPCYSSLNDTIEIPEISKFISIDEYYSTLFHELIHSTGHEKRLNRESIKKYNMHDKTRNVEELTAEIGGSYLSLTHGIKKTIKNSIAYCQSWYEAIKNNPEMLKIALLQANNSYKFIIKNTT